ncbi:hypothetical protein PHYPSEUDO_003927, partial [Phytophthora pseudosyringae]
MPRLSRGLCTSRKLLRAKAGELSAGSSGRYRNCGGFNWNSSARISAQATSSRLVSNSEVLAVYESSCALIAKIIDNSFALGYSELTRDNLRVVDDWKLYALSGTLPILILPFWDNAP